MVHVSLLESGTHSGSFARCGGSPPGKPPQMRLPKKPFHSTISPACLMHILAKACSAGLRESWRCQEVPTWKNPGGPTVGRL